MKPKCGCGRNANLKGIGKTGKKYYRTNCLTCRREAHKAKKGYCERCLMVPLDKTQLDVDHIDGNISNNELRNLQTLCKPCHRIKTKENRDYKSEKMYQMQSA